jgi:hypothetical protein
MSNVAARICVLGAALLALSGCHRSKGQADAHAALLERAFPGLASAPEQSSADGGPKAYVRAAIQAERQDDLAAAAILLKRAARTPGMTPAQVAAVLETKSAWVQELAARAERGDERAKAGLAALSSAR